MDKTEKRPEFAYTIYIATTPEKLWAALTQGDISHEYWGGRQVESEWQPESPIHFRKANGDYDLVRAKLIEFEPPPCTGKSYAARMVQSWGLEVEPDKQSPSTRVTYTIERAGPENVKLILIHETYDPGSQVVDGVRNGWPAILSSLKSYLETGTALDVTKRWVAAGL